MNPNQLFYGDNRDILLGKLIADESVDLSYMDPPFNSNRNYNQIYNNIGVDKAQAQAFVDTWVWDADSKRDYEDILSSNRYTYQMRKLIEGLYAVLGQDSIGGGSLMAYLVAMTVRIQLVWEKLKPTGSFYLHCDPTASHYLKLVCDAIFCTKDRGGDFLNEIVWRRGHVSKHGSRKKFPQNHDVVLFYAKSINLLPDFQEMFYTPYSESTMKMYKFKDGKGIYRLQELRTYGSDTIMRLKQEDRIATNKSGKEFLKQYLSDKPGVRVDSMWDDIHSIEGNPKERLGYPTQKPEALLERIIKASSNEGDVVMDAFCGCGTTVAVAHRLKRRWIGIDITYQSISLILKRLVDKYGPEVEDTITLHGVPRDMESAQALALKKDDRTRKEFEKWAVLAYTGNQGIINEKKGADKGVDGRVFFGTHEKRLNEAILSVKSGKVQDNHISALFGTMETEGAALGIFLTLEPPTKPMRERAAGYGEFELDYQIAGSDRFPRITIVTIEEILAGERFPLPGPSVLKDAKLHVQEDTNTLLEHE